MKRGCILGCLGFVLFVFLAVVGLVLLMESTVGGYLRPVPRVDLASTFGTDYPVIIRIDPSSDAFSNVTEEALQGAPWFVELFVPYEIYVVMGVDEERSKREWTAAISSRRFGKVLTWYLPIEDWDLGHGLRVHDVSAQSNGVIMVTADGSIDEDTRKAADQDWKAAGPEPYALTKEHSFEMVLDNTQAGAFLAAGPFIREWWGPKSEDEPGDRKDDEVVLSQEEVDTLLYRVSALRILGDAPRKEELEVLLEVRCPDQEAAEAVHAVLERLQEQMIAALKEEHEDARVEGALERDGAEIAGLLRVYGYEEALENATEEAVEGMPVR
ncbi:MAG: hypothetical protein WD873_04175 [Candidatus Hydrogenedentales bacterium]